MPGSEKILIGTPAYNGQVHIDYLQSLLDFTRCGIQFTVATIGNESLITRARNSIISKFHQHKGFTHLLFLDADVSLSAEQLIRLMRHEKDVIGAPVPLKFLEEDGKKRYNLGQLLDRQAGLCKTDYIGTAVLMLSRAASDALVEDACRDNRNFKFNPRSSTDPDPGEQYDVFQVGLVDGNYLSEDYWVCHKLRSLGFELYVDVSVEVRHNGMYRF